MSTLRFFLASAITIFALTLAPGQSLDHAIPIDDGDPAAPDFCFGIAMAPDGIHAAVAICGDLGFLPYGPSNDNLATIDVIAGTQVGLAQTGLFPEDPAIVTGAAGAPRNIYVTNSTSGSVTCLSPLLAPLATIALPSCFGGSSYPFGILVSPDQSRVYVSTIAIGCTEIDVIDSNPASPTFNSVVSSFTIPDSGGRMSWAPWPIMVVPTTTYDAGFTLSQAGFAVVDVTNPASAVSYVITPPMTYLYTSTTACVAVPGNRVLLSVAYDVAPVLYECSLATGAITRTLALGPGASVPYGLAVNAEQTVGVVTSLHGGQSVFFDLATFTVTGSYNHGAATLPNDVAFTPDGSRAVVSLQGVARVDVLKNLPGYDLRLAAPSAVNLGGSLTYGVSRCESGQSSLLYYSLSGAGPQLIGPFTIYLTNPFALADEGIADVHGTHSVTFTVPNSAGLSGLTVSTQAGTVDRDGAIRVSNGAQTLIN